MTSPTNDAPELLPCPFCGDGPIEDHVEPHRHLIANMPDYPGHWSVECVKCELRIFSHDSNDDARNRWNKRTDSEELKNLRRAAELLHKFRDWIHNAYPANCNEIDELIAKLGVK